MSADRIAAATERILNLKKEIENSKIKINEAEDRVATAEDKISTAKAKNTRAPQGSSTATGSVIDLEEENESLRRQLALQQELYAFEQELNALKRRHSALRQDLNALQQELIDLYTQLNEEMDKKGSLKEDLRKGRYFAKAHEIYPHDEYELIDKLGFANAADALTRKSTPRDEKTGQPLYKDIINALERHLAIKKEGEVESLANMESLSPSNASSRSIGSVSMLTPVYTPNESAPAQHVTSKTKNLVGKQGDKRSMQSKKRSNPCIIAGAVGHQGHQVPDSATCCPWWSYVCLWAVGQVKALDDLYDSIESQTDIKERHKLEKRLGGVLVKLATGTIKSSGMRSNRRNLLNVPQLHDEFYDLGCHWVIVPIMTLEELLNWSGGSYEVAIFVGEHGDGVTEPEMSGKDKYNHFKDGHTQHTAEEAEQELFQQIEPKDINICSKGDIDKVTDLLGLFLKAFADLHTRSCDGEGAPQESLSPRKWGVINLAGAMEDALKEHEKRRGNKEQGLEGSKKMNTRTEILQESKKGIMDLIKRLCGAREDEKCGVRIPKRPDSDSFAGKHVFKTSLKQTYPVDPILLGSKGAVNTGRQLGMRLMPGSRVKCDSSSLSSDSSSSNRRSSNAPLTPRELTGMEVSIVTLEKFFKKGQDSDYKRADDDDGQYSDAFSEISF